MSPASQSPLAKRPKHGNPDRQIKGCGPRFTPHRATPHYAKVSKKAAEYLMSEIAFLLNGEVTRVADAAPTRTLLDWLREDRALTGTKEGCNEGDCGACSVIVTDKSGSRSMNACILFLPQLHGCAVRTVEGISGPKGELHPVQQAMIDHHGSQCGFCTPGFITAMATAHKNGRTDHNDQLAGNLCRCTGYAPIIRAAEAAEGKPVPAWLEEDLSRLSGITETRDDWARPETTVELAKWYLDHPNGTLIGGATDVGLWVTKNLKDLGPVAFLNNIDDMSDIRITDDLVRIGAAATIADVMEAITPIYPDFAELLRRYGSAQVRNAATIGGNIANASPIGDTPPALIALGATLHLRRGVERRDVLLENYFIDYGKQDRVPGEFIEAVSFPRSADRLKCYKLSKRFDQDISAVCGCFNVRVIHGVVTSARIAFGGMASIPKRARAVETSLIGKSWDANAADRSWDAFKRDFTPLSDMRASAEYRLEAARGMLMRYLLEDLGADTRVLDVSPPVIVERSAADAARAKPATKTDDPELSAVAAAAALAASAAAEEVAAKATPADAPVSRADTKSENTAAATDASKADPVEAAESAEKTETAEEGSKAAAPASDTPEPSSDDAKGTDASPSDASDAASETGGDKSDTAEKSAAKSADVSKSEVASNGDDTSDPTQKPQTTEVTDAAKDVAKDGTPENSAPQETAVAPDDKTNDAEPAPKADAAATDKAEDPAKPDDAEETPPEQVAIILPPPAKDTPEDKS